MADKRTKTIGDERPSDIHRREFGARTKDIKLDSAPSKGFLQRFMKPDKESKAGKIVEGFKKVRELGKGKR